MKKIKVFLKSGGRRIVGAVCVVMIFLIPASRGILAKISPPPTNENAAAEGNQAAKKNKKPNQPNPTCSSSRSSESSSTPSTGTPASRMRIGLK